MTRQDDNRCRVDVRHRRDEAAFRGMLLAAGLDPDVPLTQHDLETQFVPTDRVPDYLEGLEAADADE